MFDIRDPMEIHPYSYASGMYFVCAALSHIAKNICITYYCQITFFGNTSGEYFLFDRVIFEYIRSIVNFMFHDYAVDATCLATLTGRLFNCTL